MSNFISLQLGKLVWWTGICWIPIVPKLSACSILPWVCEIVCEYSNNVWKTISSFNVPRILYLFFSQMKIRQTIFHKDFELSPSPLHCYHYYRFYCSGRCHQYHRFITISATNWSSNLGEANICLWREVQGCHMSGLYPQHAHYNDDNGDDTYNHTHDGEEGRWINVDRWYSCFGPYVFFSTTV